MMAREKLGWLITCLIVLACGCGGGGQTSPATTSAAPVVAPAITAQPVSQSTPMGLAATYSVTATGTAPQYQWSRNGVVISGANESQYVTPATGLDDTGASFTVTVSNSAGTTTSDAATLTVTARAPKTGDLRFQLVDAAQTVNGYGIGTAFQSSALIGGEQTFNGSIGTPLHAGPGDCAKPPVTNGTGCAWLFSVVSLASSLGANASGFTSGYASDSYANFQSDMQSWPWQNSTVGNGVLPFASASVVTSIDFEPDNVLFGLSWIQSSQQSGFQPTVQTVAPADLQAAATTAGANSQVITAISYNAGAYNAGATPAAITFLSYGWQADTSTIYEAQVATVSPANAATAAANLASQGYVITAIGLADSAADIVLVGTRVQGDTMPRPFMSTAVANNPTVFQQGYAMVGTINYPSPTVANTYATIILAER
jgi:hypothetical protein